jgi:hypothetical protein
MSTDIDPVLQNWYQHVDKGQEFCVVAFDDTSGAVEIQYFDGDVETIDLDDWYQLDIEPAEAPENWSGALDIEEVDDLGTGITDTTPSDWRAPQEEIRHPRERDPLIEDEEQDDWEEGSSQEELREGEP